MLISWEGRSPARLAASSNCPAMHAIYRTAGRPCWRHFKYSIRAAFLQRTNNAKDHGSWDIFFASNLRSHQGLVAAFS